IGAGLAAGRSPDDIEAAGRRLAVYRVVRRRGRFALFDSRPILDRLVRDLGDPRIEDLPTPLGISAFDLVAGRPTLITHGRLVSALERSIAVPLFFPPCPDGDGVWCDAGPWEGVPVSLARAWAPDDPVIGVWVDTPKPAFLASRYSAAFLRLVASRIATDAAIPTTRLTARRYLALLAARMADPVHREAPDLLIAPRLGLTGAWMFGRIGPMVERGERAAHEALARVEVGAAPASAHAA
ncbi:MAG: patatin-like phospholipase family protein, partial [Candidatus Limnocylindria bacterium]